ncbi:heterokaryon incompatibility protein-domain-containing protein [Xylaria scruposa]|nr:heterokaryon incompatibility protein-domain-containing protein [Xylaria scruposa]
MRLLKTERCTLIEMNDIPDPFPQYAILSHTWISPMDEITYQDFKQRKGDIDNDIFKQKGWAKLRGFCNRAHKDGWEWAWMDNCCIDKTNPADLQEAINAMFRWYQNAGICYAYLEDVDTNKILECSDLVNETIPTNSDLDVGGKDNVADPTSFCHMALKAFMVKAKWFTRGWTLQELLAPPYLVFVDRTWRRIGTRESWANEIKTASRIEARYLTSFNPADFTSCSIATRFSWASRRETTVEEDEIYSLLGMFGISLPLIYGEGRLRAFNRLQRELITVYNDDSIFAWKALPPQSRLPGALQNGYNPGRGILAPSIREFWDAFSVKSFGFYGSSFSMTNRGIEINAKRWRRKDDPSICLIRLNCGTEPSGHIGISLTRVDDSYERLQVEKLYDMRTIDYDDWEEERGNQSTFIRASSDLKISLASSIFALQYPAQISVGDKYLVDYSIDMVGASMQRLDESFLGYDLKKDELVISPNQLIFINIIMQHTGNTFELDIVLNLSDNGYPSAGIMERDREPWERLGDPMTRTLGKYEALADYLHNKIPAVYPMAALQGTDNVVGISLLPRPRLKRSLKLPQEKVNSVAPKEYVVKVTLENNSEHEQGALRHHDRKRKREF